MAVQLRPLGHWYFITLLNSEICLMCVFVFLLSGPHPPSPSPHSISSMRILITQLHAHQSRDPNVCEQTNERNRVRSSKPLLGAVRANVTPRSLRPRRVLTPTTQSVARPPAPHARHRRLRVIVGTSMSQPYVCSVCRPQCTGLVLLFSSSQPLTQASLFADTSSSGFSCFMPPH